MFTQSKANTLAPFGAKWPSWNEAWNCGKSEKTRETMVRPPAMTRKSPCRGSSRPKSATTTKSAAGIAGIASGFWSEEQYRGLLRTEKTFSPRMDREQADAYYQKWKEAVRRSRQWA